jgi:DNA repair protein RadC
MKGRSGRNAGDEGAPGRQTGTAARGGERRRADPAMPVALMVAAIDGGRPIPDTLLLELALRMVRRPDTAATSARELMKRFGSYPAAIAAPIADLRRAGMTDAEIMALKAVQSAAIGLLRSEVMDRPVINSWDKLMDYLHAVLARETVEHFRVLYLDTRNRLKADEAQARGTVNHTPVYPREVVKRALELEATALILVHNHPSGDPTPSRADIEMTRAVQKATTALGIALHDHVIVGNGRWLSFRQQGLL